jgi:hypothetical protein
MRGHAVRRRRPPSRSRQEAAVAPRHNGRTSSRRALPFVATKGRASLWCARESKRSSHESEGARRGPSSHEFESAGQRSCGAVGNAPSGALPWATQQEAIHQKGAQTLLPRVTRGAHGRQRRRFAPCVTHGNASALGGNARALGGNARRAWQQRTSRFGGNARHAWPTAMHVALCRNERNAWRQRLRPTKHTLTHALTHTQTHALTHTRTHTHSRARTHTHTHRVPHAMPGPTTTGSQSRAPPRGPSSVDSPCWIHPVPHKPWHYIGSFCKFVSDHK